MTDLQVVGPAKPKSAPPPLTPIQEEAKASEPPAEPAQEKPEKVEADVLDIDEDLAPLCADAYGDAFGLAATWIAKVDVTLPEDRLDRRGRQLAMALKKLGWDDVEIVMMVSLAGGVASDLTYLYKAKREHERAQAADGGASSGGESA